MKIYRIARESEIKKCVISGKAMNYNKQMIDFAKETVNKLDEIVKNNQFAIGKEVNSEFIVTDKYGGKFVTVIIANIEDDYNDKDVRASASAVVDKGEIHIYKKSIDKISIIHELIHLFDPRLNKMYSEFNFETGNMDPPKYVYRKPMQLPKEDQDNSVYYNLPWEQEAYMRNIAMERVERIQSESETMDIKDVVQKLKPITYQENEYYKNKKLWHRYLQTIYSELNNEFREKPDKNYYDSKQKYDNMVSQIRLKYPKGSKIDEQTAQNIIKMFQDNGFDSYPLTASLDDDEWFVH